MIDKSSNILELSIQAFIDNHVEIEGKVNQFRKTLAEISYPINTNNPISWFTNERELDVEKIRNSGFDVKSDKIKFNDTTVQNFINTYAGLQGLCLISNFISELDKQTQLWT
jgi:transcriptional regulator CtsR